MQAVPVTMEWNWSTHADERFLKQLDTDIEKYFGHIPQYHADDEHLQDARNMLLLAGRFVAAKEHARSVLIRQSSHDMSQTELHEQPVSYRPHAQDYHESRCLSQPELRTSYGACYAPLDAVPAYTSQGVPLPEIQLQFYARAPPPLVTRRVSHERPYGTYSLRKSYVRQI